jgi:uncharacterized protein (DUF697 family)
MTELKQEEPTDEAVERAKSQRADRIINTHVLWSMGAGLMPIPLFDIAAVTTVQIDLLKQLAENYEADFSNEMGKTFVTALTGGTFARIGASLLKTVPGIGTLIGGVSMSVMSGASTFAVGQVAKRHFETDGNIINFDLDFASNAYDDAFEKGKRVVSDLKGHMAESKDIYKSLERLGELRDKGVITDEEFETKKQELLERL